MVLVAVEVAVASLVLGGLTSWGQSGLPSAVDPVSNSISGWTMVTAVVVRLAHATVARSAVLGALTFVALTVGYAIVSAIRGFSYDPTTWAVIGLAAGPFVGAAAGALRSVRRRQVAIGSGLLAGVLAADSYRGFTVVLAGTGWFYWTAVAVVSVTFVVVVAVRRLRDARLVALQVGVAVAVAVATDLGISVVGRTTHLI